jgi:trans-aconitate methyltransferase/quercetin dioxygenase-like cupin family protein
MTSDVGATRAHETAVPSTTAIREDSAQPFLQPGHGKIFSRYRRMPRAALREWQHQLTDIIKELPSAPTILDLGCGSGRFTLPIAQLTHDQHPTIYAIDRSAEMIATLRKRVRTHHHITTVIADFLAWQPPVRFDFIFISEVLHLVTDLDAFLTRVAAVLAPGGVLAIRTPSHDQLDEIEWLRLAPSLLALDKQRTVDTVPLINRLTTHHIRVTGIQEVDESVRLRRTEYLGMLEHKAYSILHLLDATGFEAFIRSVRRATDDETFIKRNFHINLLTCTNEVPNMRMLFKKSLNIIPVEDAHGGSGQRQLILSKADDVSSHFQAMTKGFLASGSIFDWHNHEGVDELFVVLKGAGLVKFRDGDGAERVLPYEPGDVFYTPGGEYHRIEANGGDTSEYFFIRLDA